MHKQRLRALSFGLALTFIGGQACSTDQEIDKGLHYYMKGLSLYRGYDGQADKKKGCDHFEQSAKLNNSRGQVEYGNCYKFGEGREQDVEKAVYWYKKAADSGETQGQFLLGALYLLHKNYKEYRKEGLDLVTKAWSAKHADAGFLIGVSYYQGIVNQANYSKALEYFQLSGELGSIQSQIVMHEIYTKGLYKQAPDSKKAEFWKKKVLGNERYQVNEGFINNMKNNLRVNKLGIE